MRTAPLALDAAYEGDGDGGSGRSDNGIHSSENLLDVKAWIGGCG